MTNEAKITATLFSLSNCNDCYITRNVMQRLESKYGIEVNEVVFYSKIDAKKYGINALPTVLLDMYSIEGCHLSSIYIDVIEELKKRW